MTYTLYAAPGACSRVPLMALEEAGADFDLKLVRFMKGEHKRPDYLAMHPAGKVPLLITPEGPLSQNVAIAKYLGVQFPDLLPKADTPMDDARITADLAFCADTLHPIVTRMRMPMFMADGPEAQASVRAKAFEAMAPMAKRVNDQLEERDWWYGDDWSIMDAYIYWVWFRITGVGFPGSDYPNWAAHADRMETRPAIQRALARDAELQATLEAEGLAPPMKWTMSVQDIRRVVTGHSEDGKAIVLSDGDLPHVTRPPHQPGLAFHEIWNTDKMPMPLGAVEDEPTERHRDTAPPANGTIIRIVDIPPEGQDGPDFNRDEAEALFEAVGLAENAKHMIPGRHPLMHRTESVDYGVVLSGEITLLLEEDEVPLKPGDVVIQRGTIHAWANRSDGICRMLFVLTDARFDPDLAQAQARHDAKLRVQSS